MTTHTGRPPRPPSAESPPVRATGPLAEYQRLVTALATAANRQAGELTAAEQAYASGVLHARDELAAAQAHADHAERRAAHAAATVAGTDQEVARLWAELRRALGWRGVLLGDPPAPACGLESLEPEALLARARDRIAGLRRSGARTPLPWWAMPVLPVVGALTATLLALVAGGLVTLGQGGSTVASTLRILGYLSFLAAPLAGVPAAVLLADRYLNSRLGTGAVALTMIGGMIAGCAVSLALR